MYENIGILCHQCRAFSQNKHLDGGKIIDIEVGKRKINTLTNDPITAPKMSDKIQSDKCSDTN